MPIPSWRQIISSLDLKLLNYGLRRIKRAGLPAKIEKEGTERVTTLQAPITEKEPIITPGSKNDLAPMKLPSLIMIGLVISGKLIEEKSCVPVQIYTS